jgi:hypothetical protein
VAGILNPFQSFGSLGPPLDLAEPWAEVDRQETIASGKLTISGLNLQNIQVVRLLISGVAVTTDDSTVSLRFRISGSEVSSGYRWGMSRNAPSLDTGTASTSDSSIMLTPTTATQGVGNASTEGLNAVVTVYAPGSITLHKRCHYRSVWSRPDGTLIHAATGVGDLGNTGAITGFVVLGSSDLTAGTMIALGVE